MSGSLIGG